MEHTLRSYGTRVSARPNRTSVCINEVMLSRVLVLGIAVAMGLCAAEPGTIAEAVEQVDTLASHEPAALAFETRILAAESLHGHHPELARKLVEESERELGDGKEWLVESPMIPGLLHRLISERPAEAVQAFGRVLAVFPFAHPTPSQAWWLTGCIAEMSSHAPKEALQAIERLLPAVAEPNWGEGEMTLAARFQVGPQIIETNRSRDTVLLAMALDLRALAPAQYTKQRAWFEIWDPAIRQLSAADSLKAAQPISVRSRGSAVQPTAAQARIQQQLPQMRGELDKQARAELAARLAKEIRDLPAGPRKLPLARALRNLSTEGDLGPQALQEVADTAIAAMKQAEPKGEDFLELAKLVRYEHVKAPEDPSLSANLALLRLRELVEQNTDFTLKGLDGNSYALHALRGRVVLLNFWATWCPPCRKEMPDLERLYREFRDRGLIVLAVSDEEAETVTPFVEKEGYTFPVLLDPGRGVHEDFNVEGIPKSFVIDKQGRLVAQAIDMRTREQFLVMLRQAGLSGGATAGP